MRGMRKAAAGAAAVVLAAGVIAGCGSSGDSAASGGAESVASEATTAAALTKAEFVAKANAICTKIDDVVSSIGDNADADSLAQAEAALSKATAAAKQGVADLKALVPPAALATAHATLVETSGASIALATKLADAAKSGNIDAATLSADLEQAVALEKKQFAAAKELGLSNCFTGSSDATDGAND